MHHCSQQVSCFAWSRLLRNTISVEKRKMLTLEHQMPVSYSCLVEVESRFSESASSGLPLGSGPKAIVVVYDIFGFTTQAKQVRCFFFCLIRCCTTYVLCMCRASFGRFTSSISQARGDDSFSKGARADEAFQRLPFVFLRAVLIFLRFRLHRCVEKLYNRSVTGLRLLDSTWPCQTFARESTGSWRIFPQKTSKSTDLTNSTTFVQSRSKCTIYHPFSAPATTRHALFSTMTPYTSSLVAIVLTATEGCKHCPLPCYMLLSIE